MVNFNGSIQDEMMLSTNRAFLYGDAVFETLKIVEGRILFFEDHYFRLMASMRILRMKIPMSFTLEFLENEVLKLVKEANLTESSRVRLTVFRNDGGFYLPKDNAVSYLISVQPLLDKKYHFSSDNYEVELYKDFYITKQLLSTLKTTNKAIQVVGSIYAEENGYQNCLLLNEEKSVVEALNGNLFMMMGDTLITPPLTEGCLNGILRKQLLSIAKNIEGLTVTEAPISPFDLQKASELFITNVITGIQPITKYRKKEFETNWSKLLLEKVNELI
ncbi:aminotransferase class IV [Flavobacterium filum]|uniref:aminotransferase class IV n=1 Tax=Flavobacterium TaxID=237 RepID=UPI0003FF07C2|nr:aminotransferase class IV [Flavobacterium filum]